MPVLDKKIKNTFLSLVRLGTGHPAAGISEAIDWTKMRALAYQQGLSAIVLDGATALFDAGELVGDRAMDADLRRRWVADLIQNYEQRYVDYRIRIGELAGFYGKHGIRMMVLKGYGLSLDWPRPEHRPCGDIDIWTFGRHREADVVLRRETGIEIDISHHHHTVFPWKGYTVENHYDWVNVHYGHGNAALEKIFKSFAMDDSHATDIDGQKVYLPSPDLHALFLVRHSMLHFVSTKMNLRQILDWGFFVKRYTAEIDWDWLTGVLGRYKMTDFFTCLNAICICDLGFDRASFPVLQMDGGLKERVLEDTLLPEFSGTFPPDAGLVRRIGFKYRRWKAHAWKRRLCYTDSCFKSFWISAWSHLLKPSSIWNDV